MLTPGPNRSRDASGLAPLAVAAPQESAGASYYGVARKTRARRFLGSVKYRVVDRWPYAILRAYGQRRREHWRSEILGLPPLAVSGGPGDMEIHMYCGEAQLDMGICASWSFMRFCDDARLYVHSDGSLSPGVFAQWQKVVPETVLVPHTVADEKFMRELGQDLPTLAKWRSRYWCAKQVIDYHLFGEAESLVGMDSDVLCFRRPGEIEDALRGEGQGFTWGRDLSDHYSADRGLLEAVTGVPVPGALNGGLLACPRFTAEDFAFMEQTLNALEAASVDIFHWAMAQTLLAIVAGRYGASRPLPSTYDVTLGRTKADIVTRHYVGLWSVRPRYFTEGVPRLVGELASSSRPA